MYAFVCRRVLLYAEMAGQEPYELGSRQFDCFFGYVQL